MTHAITINPLEWFPRRVSAPDPLPPNELTLVRAEFQAAIAAAIAAERAERQQVASDLATVRTSAAETERDLKATREELARSRAYGRDQANLITQLNSTIESINKASERLTLEFSGLSSANGALQEALRRLEADHRVDQETIKIMHGQIEVMKAEIVRLTDLNAQYVGTNAGKQLAIDELNKRMALAIDRLTAAGLSIEGLT